MKKFKKILWLSTAVFLFAGTTFLMERFGNYRDRAGGTAIAHVDSDSVTEKIPRLPEKITSFNYTEINGVLRPGDSFDDSMKRLKISNEIRYQIISNFSKCLDFRRLSPKDKYSVFLDEEGKLGYCLYEAGPLEIYDITRTEQGFETSRVPIPLEYRTSAVEGVIQYSLFNAFQKLEEGPSLIRAFADIFASQIDFNTDTQQDDRFSLIVEKIYKKDNKFVGYGRILAARYEQTDNTVTQGFYFSSDKTPDGYYDPAGKGLSASFIRSPIPYGRVSSGFSYKRKHPILGIVRPHLGVDLAAPIGTPIMASADGKVKFMGTRGGYGRQIVLDHKGGYRTYYGHLSRFKKGLKTGSKVKQKDIIGYVGSTGLSTGPHLDYRVRCQGVFINPFSIKAKPKAILKGDELALFREREKEMERLMNSVTGPQVLHVKSVTFTSEESIFLL